VAGTESPALVEILEKARCRVETFGLHEGADWRATDVTTGPDGSRFRLLRRGRDEGAFALKMGGEHNVRNALAALAAAAEAGVEPGALREALSAFRGVKRRLEIRGEAGGVTVYDDFAHHPTAVAATLAALRALGGGGRLVAVFEPRSFTAKTRAFQEGFARAFAGADRVIVSAAHLPGKVPEGQRLSEAELVAGIGRLGTDASFIPTVDAIVEALVAEVRPGDRVVILSNGGFGGIHDKLLRALEAAART
jgi:UDP-N-acetylmuramate: L-alanyl-gamma-D-glutamyl-meso-diaminopimelate ligase